MIFSGDAIVLLPQLAAKYSPDVIYLDPMFLDTGNTALPKKQMLLLRMLDESDFSKDCSNEHSSDQLLTAAIATKCKKIIVKRHKLSPYLLNKKPHHSFVGKANRFDVYLDV
jgi:16S rRNA (guanine1516-N2)-methyltransferase